jgi:hypothetical protein
VELGLRIPLLLRVERGWLVVGLVGVVDRVIVVLEL